MNGATYEEQVAELVSEALKEYDFKVTHVEHMPKYIRLCGLKVDNAYIYFFRFYYDRREHLVIPLYVLDVTRYKPESVLEMDSTFWFPAEDIGLPTTTRIERRKMLCVPLYFVEKDVAEILGKIKRDIGWESTEIQFASKSPFFSQIYQIVTVPRWLYNDVPVRFLLGGLVIYGGG